MSLAREWRRQVSRASGAALVVPVAVFGSMVLLALAGGFGQLGGLGQALAGPAAPSASPAGTRLTADAHATLAPLLPVVAGAGGPTLVASVKLSPTAVRGGGHVGPGGGRSPGSGNRGGSTPPVPLGTTTPPTQTGPAPPGTEPTAPPTLVDGVVSVGTSITSKIPGEVGNLATSTLQDVGQTVDRVLPSNARRAASSVSGTVSSTVSQLQNGVGKLGSGVSSLVQSAKLP